MMRKKQKNTEMQSCNIYYCSTNITDIPVSLASTEQGLIFIDIGGREEDFHQKIIKHFIGARLIDSTEENKLYIRELTEYFLGKRKQFTVPLHLVGTEFQKKVWRALLEVPYGKTVTYKDIAKKIGNPKALRAVGMANNKNKIPIIVPCHRVIGSDGKLTGYAAGLSIKEKLLKLEGIQVEGEKVVI